MPKIAEYENGIEIALTLLIKLKFKSAKRKFCRASHPLHWRDPRKEKNLEEILNEHNSNRHEAINIKN